MQHWRRLEDLVLPQHAATCINKQRLAVLNIVRRMGHVMLENDTPLLKALG
jgi:hypothetical protein